MFRENFKDYIKASLVFKVEKGLIGKGARMKNIKEQDEIKIIDNLAPVGHWE